MECIFQATAGLHVVAVLASPIRQLQLSQTQTLSLVNCTQVAWEEMKRNGYDAHAVHRHPFLGLDAAVIKRTHKITWRESTAAKRATQINQLVSYATDLAVVQAQWDQHHLSQRQYDLNVAADTLTHYIAQIGCKPRVRIAQEAV
ncbi:hypothetical protein [Pseudoxanthomonas winnipegensis]|uniref:hypothetical protein n=1 Tax=Pseudoxanthomonas winnipegensis TaxID=2480810 RepID=UPI00103D1028|nr:hypothetical protein [Pseudoxanthomonas winnipegensis]TBV69743.1 hypothetical protein EYC45_19025 [Pseudoxanthomonas winnipegensis]